MALTASQINYIVELNDIAKNILRHGGQEELLMSLPNKMNKIKKLLDYSSKNELDLYCEKYDGFYQYMILLESLASATADGVFDDILK